MKCIKLRVPSTSLAHPSRFLSGHGTQAQDHRKNLGITESGKEFFRLNSALVWNIAICWIPRNEITRKPRYYSYFSLTVAICFKLLLSLNDSFWKNPDVLWRMGNAVGSKAAKSWNWKMTEKVCFFDIFIERSIWI